MRMAESTKADKDTHFERPSRGKLGFGIVRLVAVLDYRLGT